MRETQDSQKEIHFGPPPATYRFRAGAAPRSCRARCAVVRAGRSGPPRGWWDHPERPSRAPGTRACQSRPGPAVQEGEEEMKSSNETLVRRGPRVAAAPRPPRPIPARRRAQVDFGHTSAASCRTMLCSVTSSRRACGGRFRPGQFSPPDKGRGGLIRAGGLGYDKKSAAPSASEWRPGPAFGRGRMRPRGGIALKGRRKLWAQGHKGERVRIPDGYSSARSIDPGTNML